MWKKFDSLIGRKSAPAELSFEQWRQKAREMDAREGNEAWRLEDESPFFDANLLRRHIAELEDLANSRNFTALESTVTESLYRNLPDVSAADLYGETHSGETKVIVSQWLEACERAIILLRSETNSALTNDEKRARFKRAAANFGSPALLLSGGGAWGLYHLGVVRALNIAGLLPQVICGSSMGAIVAAGVCTRTDEQLRELLDNPAQIHRTAVELLAPREIFASGVVLSTNKLREHVEANVGDFTFAEAYEKTGRILNVTISPTRARQKPRVLSYRTAPDVLISDATVASCSIPGLFPAVALRARNSRGEISPYVPTERWVDGSMRGDLPVQRLARLHNVNHFIVSQANPFVLPFVIRRHHGSLHAAARIGGSLFRAQTAAILDETRRRVSNDRLRPFLDTAHALTGQTYGGDINIHPRVPVSQYLRVMANPSLAQLHEYIRGGELATWPHLAEIRNQTRIARLLASCAR